MPPSETAPLAKPETPAETTIDALADHPERIIRLTNAEMHAIPLPDQQRLQLRAAMRRFEQLVERVPLLGRLAREQGLSRIRRLEDIGLLLVPHSASKSYALSLVETNRYDRMTSWLQGFTALDLSSTDVASCESLDEWIDALDAQTPLRVVHSTGTSGKLSFIPRGVAESRQYVHGYVRQFDVFGDERPLLGVPPAEAPLLYLQYRRGAYGQQRMLDFLETDLFGGDASMIVPINPARFSADAISLGGRLRAAEARGGRPDLSTKLLARRDSFLKEQEAAEGHLQTFLDEVAQRFRGHAVSVMGHIPQLYRVALAGLARGDHDMFSDDSFVAGGGGLKGVALPDDWRATVARYLGPVSPTPGYGMSELVGVVRMCPAGHYHLPPWQVPFLLDPQTGAQLPRTGVQTGRFGALDLNAESHWGGFLTSDAVTVAWGDETPCACGRIGPYLHGEIRRYSDAEGGDDKITCAGAPQAYDKALDYIVRMGG